MPFTLTMPKLSPTMEEGSIVKWRKKEGEFVKPGDVLFEVATDKATVEHSALDEGFLRKILIKEGQSASVNQAVAIFTEKESESIEGYKPEGVVPSAPQAVKTEEKKVELPPPSPSVGQPVFLPDLPFGYSSDARIIASPLARKLAKERNIDLSTIQGSGPHGRIVEKDLGAGQKKGAFSFGKREKPTLAPGTYEEKPLTPMRKVIAKRLQESKTFIPHFYVVQEIHAGALVKTREELKEGGIKVSINDMIVRASSLALREHMQINCGFNSAASSVIQFKTVDISIAVNLEEGLITPIVRHADYKNLGEISSEIKHLAEKARLGKLSREEYMGGSFTVSNLGMFGITEFTAVINPPQAAILAVGGINEKPVVKNGEIVSGKTMVLTLSVDHRVIDGAEAAKFLKTVQKLLENPALIII